jgi:hypothetical protein
MVELYLHSPICLHDRDNSTLFRLQIPVLCHFYLLLRLTYPLIIFFSNYTLSLNPLSKNLVFPEHSSLSPFTLQRV